MGITLSYRFIHRCGSYRRARFPLVADSQHKYDILPSLMAVKSHIAALAIRDRKFSQSCLARSTNERMSRKNVDAVANHIDGFNRSLWSMLDEKFSEALYVGECVSRINYFRHIRAFGAVTRSPRTRAAK